MEHQDDVFNVIDVYENKEYIVPTPKPSAPDFPVTNQPQYTNAGRTINRAPSPKSVRRLEMLNFDPITKLVERHSALTKELEYQEKRRKNEIVELTGSGKARAFMMDHLLMIHSQLFTIEKELLRYGYGRVPEQGMVENTRTAPLVINLTKKGEQYIVNDYGPSSGEE
jgi:hypothetical protein